MTIRHFNKIMSLKKNINEILLEYDFYILLCYTIFIYCYIVSR